MAEIIAKTAQYVIAKERYGDTLELRKRWYPLPGYGNNVCTRILFVSPNTVKVVTTRDSWGGTGSDIINWIELEPDEFNRLRSLADNIKTIEDFDKLTSEIEKIEKKMEEEIEKLFDNVLDSLATLEVDARFRELLKERERVREILWREIDDC